MQPTPAPTSAPTSPGRGDSEPLVEQTTYATPPQNVDSAPFSVLVALYDRLQTERKPERRRKLLSTWFTHWRQEKGYDLYPVLRLILPQKDKERAVYGLKEKNLAKTYVKMIPLGMRDPDAIRLLNWKRPTERDKTAGEFSTVLFEVVSKRSSVIEGTLSIDDLNELLDELSKNSGKQEIQSKILQRIYNRSTPEEQRWIVRIILKDMTISVKETTIFSVFHPDAQDLYNTCSDLKKVAYDLCDPARKLNNKDKEVQLFHAFAPMLCKRPTKRIEETVRLMNGAEFIIEEKLDGERMQLHKNGNEYFYCSRKGKNYTYLYGKDRGQGSLTPHIHQTFDKAVKTIILDGEMLVWDPVSERNLPFGTLKTAALDQSKKEQNPRPCFKVFDLLYLNGSSLLDTPLKTRKKLLKNCLQEVKGRIEFGMEWNGTTGKDIRAKMDQIMVSRGEGLVIKDPLSSYELNGRNLKWIKVKPEYMDNMGETVDVLVVAGNYGSGTRGRAGGVSSLICAVYDDRRKYDNDDDPKYSTFVRIGTGLSYADYIWIRQLPWKRWDPKHPPEFLQTAKRGQEDKGDLYILPEDSFIIKAKAAEITPTDQYHMGYTMRFPRALTIRDDLSVQDCVSAAAVMESLRSDKKRKPSTDIITTKKKAKTKHIVLSEYKGIKAKDVTAKSTLFEGMTFVVLSDPKSRSGEEDKTMLQRQIYTHGGACAQVVTTANKIVVYGGSVTPIDVKRIIDKNRDIIKPSWLLDSIEKGQKMPLRKKYFFHASEESMASEEYNEEEGPENVESISRTTDRSPTLDSQEESSNSSREKLITLKTEEVDMDPELAEWFKVDNKTTGFSEKDNNDEDSVTEDDSDNADVANEEEVDLDDWFQVNKDTSEKVDGKQAVHHGGNDIKMGETNSAMEYDQEFIFKHLCFYLDSPDNATKNGLSVKPTKHEEAINTRFSQITELIIANGGKVVDLDSPKLTHVVVDQRDVRRRLELIERTSKPKMRNLVISDYIQACLDEGTLLDEKEFEP